MRYPFSLRIHYTGPPEIIGNKIDPAHLLVDVVYDDKSYRRLLSDEYIVFPSKEINDTKKNFYVLQYTENQVTISKEFSVFALTHLEFEDKSLKVIFHSNTGPKDVTDYFEKILYEPLLDKIVFDFRKFSSHAWDGLFQITVPITKNIQSRNPGEWLVRVKDYGYEASILSQYRKEKEQ